MSLRAFVAGAVFHGRCRPWVWTPLLALIFFAIAPAIGSAHEGGLELTVSPTDIAAGDIVTVSGEGFTASVAMEIHLSGPNGDAHFGDVMVDAEGNFVQKVTIPSNVLPGLYLIRATGDREASAELSVGAMAGMAVSADELAAERSRSAAWKIVALVAFLGVAGFGTKISRPGRRTASPSRAA